MSFRAGGAAASRALALFRAGGAAASMAGPTSRARVAYIHDPEVSQFYYGPGHPMKPQRMQVGATSAV